MKLLLCLLLLLPSLTFAEQPLGLQGINIGMPALDVVSKVKGDNGGFCFGASCEIRLSIKGIPAKAHYSFTANPEKDQNSLLERIFIEISPDNYELIVKALIEKYGQPQSIKTVPIQNKMGAQFVNKKAVWNLTDGRIYSDKYSNNLEEGSILIINKILAKEIDDEIKRNMESPGF